MPVATAATDPAQLALIYQRIRAEGGRVTAPKRLVIETVADETDHLTAEAIVARVEARAPGVARSTIYRVLQSLADVGVIEHVHNGRDPAFYHLHELSHAHLVCTGCGSIVDVDDALFDEFRGNAERRYGFTVDVHHGAIFGRCASCRAHDS